MELIGYVRVLAKWIMKEGRAREMIIFGSIAILCLANFRILLAAYHIMIQGALPQNDYALDFGSYYTAAWRLIHNPSQLYAHGIVNGDYPLGVFPTQFKYLPYFAVFMIPLLTFDYTSALVCWNIFQFLLLPIIGFMIYRSLKNMNALVILVSMSIIIIQPLPFPPLYLVSLHRIFFSQSYYWQWAEGQSKVFLTFLIVASYYFAKEHKPYISGVSYGLAFYDPRFGLLAIPLFLMVNRKQYRKFSASALLTLVAGSSILLYDGLSSSFVDMVLNQGITTVFFDYTWIPFYAIIVLTVVESAVLFRSLWSCNNKGSPLSKFDTVEESNKTIEPQS